MEGLTMQFHRYDVIIRRAGGAGCERRSSPQPGPYRVLTSCTRTRSHTGAAQGGMCAALANVEDDNWECTPSTPSRAVDYLVDQDAAEVMCRRPSTRSSTWRRWACRHTGPGGPDRPAPFRRATRNHGEAAVRTALLRRGPHGHMILQTLYQNCVSWALEFYNEYYVLD